MNKPSLNAANPSSEMLSLNLDDLNVEELERRLELAAALPAEAMSPCDTNTCGTNICGKNT